MKKVVLVLIIISFITIIPAVNVYAGKVPMKGDWAADVRTRSLRLDAPEIFVDAPEVYIEDNVVTIYLKNALQNMFILIADNSGNVIYQGYISTYQPCENYIIYLREKVLNGYIELSHSSGTLTGFFSQK